MMEIVGPTLTLRPIAAADVPALVAIRNTPEVARWWGEPEPGWPLDDLEPGMAIYAMWRDRTVVGLIQTWEEPDPRYRAAAIDLFVDPACHRQGVATEALQILVGDLIARGHHRITIDPALDNTGAIACYAGVGFAPVGVMRGYERIPETAPPHDGLLMELVVAPPSGPAQVPPAVALRPAFEADLDAILAAEGAPQARDFVGQDPRERHAAAITDPARELLVIADADGAFAGYVLLAGIGNRDTGIELRRVVVVRPGQGIGRAALRDVLARAFTTHRTHRVWLDVRIDNRRARELYASLGFRTDGILRAAMHVDGRQHDALLMSLLAAEWAAS
jgi:aminoglycoside 6'-N-acetyltransferase